MTLATDYRQKWNFSGNKTCSINFFTSQKLFVRLNYGFWSFAIRARTNSFVKIFASDAADAQTNTFVIENWTTLGQQPFRLKKHINVRTRYKKGKRRDSNRVLMTFSFSAGSPSQARPPGQSSSSSSPGSWRAMLVRLADLGSVAPVGQVVTVLIDNWCQQTLLTFDLFLNAVVFIQKEVNKVGLLVTDAPLLEKITFFLQLLLFLLLGVTLVGWADHSWGNTEERGEGNVAQRFPNWLSHTRLRAWHARKHGLSLSLSLTHSRAHTHTHSSPLPTRFLAAESRK